MTASVPLRGTSNLANRYSPPNSASRRSVAWSQSQAVSYPGLPSPPKEILQHGCAFAAKHSLDHFRLVVQAGMVKDTENRASRAGLGILRTKHYAAQSGLHDCTSTHCAGFDCNIEVATLHPVVAQFLRGTPYRKYFRVRGGIMQMDGPIMSPRQNSPLPDDYRPHGNLLFAGRTRRFAERQAHKALMFRPFRTWGGITSHVPIVTCQNTADVPARFSQRRFFGPVRPSLPP